MVPKVTSVRYNLRRATHFFGNLRYKYEVKWHAPEMLQHPPLSDALCGPQSAVTMKYRRFQLSIQTHFARVALAYYAGEKHPASTPQIRIF